MVTLVEEIELSISRSRISKKDFKFLLFVLLPGKKASDEFSLLIFLSKSEDHLSDIDDVGKLSRMINYF